MLQRGTIPNLQSIVIILLKVLLSNITVLGTPTNAQNPEDGGDVATNARDIERLPLRNLNLSNYLSTTHEQQAEVEPRSNVLEVLNSIRTREITSKAISGLILTLLKWLRLSR